MGTGMSDRTALFSGLGAMYGMLIFSSTSLIGAAKDEDLGLTGDDRALLSDIGERVSRVVDRLEELHRTLSGDELQCFVAGLAEAAETVLNGLRRDLGE